MIPKYQPASLPLHLAEALQAHLGIAASSPGRSVSEAARFLRTRQLATLWGGAELPSLYEVECHELAPRRIAFASPSVAKTWAWANTLVESGEFLLVRLFRRRMTFVARPLWPALARLALFGLEDAWYAGSLSTAAYRIAQVLGEQGPCDLLGLRDALLRRFPILPVSVSQGLRELEDKLVIYAQRLGETRAGETATAWELLGRRLTAEQAAATGGTTSEAVRTLVRAAVGAAGIVDSRESTRWFPNWKYRCSEELAELVRCGEISRLSDGEPEIVIYAALLEAVREASGVAASCY